MSKALQRIDIALPIGSLDAYIHQVNQIPMLTDTEEKELTQRLFETGDREVAKRLVMSHLRFVVSTARKYSGYGLSQADLIQEGNIGLMKAVKRFDPSVGVRLVSFAVHWIRAEMHEFILRNWKIVKIATTKAQRKLFFNLRKASKKLNWLSKDEISTISENLNVSENDVIQMEARLSSYDESFDPVQTTHEDSTYLAPADYLTSNEKPDLLLERADNADSRKDALYQALETLDERSQSILSRRWLARDEQKPTLSELAKEYNISLERVRQIEKAAMNKIKSQFEPLLALT